MNPIDGLRLHRPAPPGIHDEDAGRGREVQAHAAGAQAQQEHFAPRVVAGHVAIDVSVACARAVVVVRGEGGENGGSLLLGHAAVEAEVREVGAGEDRFEQVEEGGELAEDYGFGVWVGFAERG